jgi:hypothetical protein
MLPGARGTKLMKATPLEAVAGFSLFQATCMAGSLELNVTLPDHPVQTLFWLFAALALKCVIALPSIWPDWLRTTMKWVGVQPAACVVPVEKTVWKTTAAATSSPSLRPPLSTSVPSVSHPARQCQCPRVLQAP